MDAQTLYQMLGQVIADTPDFSGWDPITDAQNRWLGKVCALVAAGGDAADSVMINVAAQNMVGPLRHSNAQMINAILHRTLAVAELKAPVSAQGAFIPAGSAFTALAAIGKVLKTSTADVLLVDPYMDDKALSDYAVLADERVTCRLLADGSSYKPSLKPAVIAWISQYGASRPLEVRLTSPRAIHDRLVIIDGLTVFTLTQSLNAFATRAPASVVRVDPETGRLKIAAYADIWANASPL